MPNLMISHRFPVLPTVLVLTAILAATVVSPYLAAAILAFGILIYATRYYRLPSRKRLLAELRKKWGTESDHEPDLDKLAAAYAIYRPFTKSDNLLDDFTWADLNMDEIYWTLDRTLTNAGEFALYSILRDIGTSPESLLSRIRLLQALEKTPSARDHVLLPLSRLGRDASVDLVRLLWGAPSSPLGPHRVYTALAVAAGLSLVSLIPFGFLGFLCAVLPVFLINCIITQTLVRGDILIRLRTLRYLGKLIAVGHELSKDPLPELAPWHSELTRVTEATRTIAQGIHVLNPETSFTADFVALVGYYASVFFLVEVRTFGRVMEAMEQHRTDLRSVVCLVGELDALQSVASYRSSLPSYCEPEFAEGAPSLHMVDGWHPLVPQPVPNTLRTDGHNLFVTGSNMAGKSTFLRMVAINVVLAQTLGTCCAKQYRATRFHLTTSMAHGDEITSGTSYFLAESRRLLHVLNCASTERVSYLCLLDEILRGTNSLERHAASLAILRLLARTPALSIVASHDTELGQLLEADYRLCHFTETFHDQRMEFDYQLRPGVCNMGNAIRTLDLLGFPAEVSLAAREHLDRSGPSSPSPHTAP